MDNERLIEYMIEDLREVKKDVKSLLQFKWQLMGGTVVISLIVGVVIQLVIGLVAR
jgi:ABC-type antimicrobial peptide transport system permease subunit